MTEASTASNPNQHILEYLDYYCDPDNSFDFAVMLRGPWGVGKTFLIQRFLESRKAYDSDTSTLYVTLYGVTSYQQIDEQLFTQTHPILASKEAKFFAQIAKGLLKEGLKIDLTGKDTDLRNYISPPNRCVIVFDDLERCTALSTSDVMGYINTFVEHQNCKVIIISDENKLYEKGDRYNEIKEKLVGQTLEVQPTTELTVREFLQAIRTDRVRAFLFESIPLITSIHTQSQTSNLRILKQTLWDFERLASCLSDAHWANSPAKRSLLGLVLAVS